MHLQFGHSRDYDFVTELYAPLKASALFSQHTIILPHDTDGGVDSSQTLKTTDIFFAEVSYPSTGLGIELGLAYAYGTPIVCFSKTGTSISSSLHHICKDFFTYTDAHDMLHQIEKYIQRIKEE